MNQSRESSSAWNGDLGRSPPTAVTRKAAACPARNSSTRSGPSSSKASAPPTRSC